jgi:RimJ/RimL family protein N-acetyltransferase
MIAIPNLQTGRLILRAFTIDDTPRVEALLSSPEIAPTTLTMPRRFPAGMAKRWIRLQPEKLRADQAIDWAITLPDDLVIGAIGLTLELRHRRGSVGYWLGTDHWNQGYVTEALRAVVAWAFEALELSRIEGTCFPRNPASGRVMEKAGMTYEGRLRSYVVKDGVSEDVLVYASVNGRIVGMAARSAVVA